MENQELENNNGMEHKDDVQEVITVETSGNDEYADEISKASEAMAETAANNALSEDATEEEIVDESQKIIDAEQTVEVVGDSQMNEQPAPVAATEEKTEEEHHELILQQIEAHTEEVAEPLENYDSMNKAELLEKFSALMVGDDAVGNKTKAFAIRDAFNKITSQERSEAFAKFIEDGGNKDDFEKSKDELDEKFNSLFDKYKKKRSDQVEAAEKLKADNLVAKQEILNQLKALIQNEENMQKAYNEFNELQTRWRAIGAVPAANVRDLLMNYKLYVDRFYDFVKINRELQALDQKKNLLLKVNLCERAEQLMLEGSINRAIGQINNLMFEWREIGPIPREKKDELWQRFKSAVDKVFDRKREHEDSLKGEHDENIKLKQALIERITPLADKIYDKHNLWQDALKEVMAITNEYKKIGHAGRKENEEAWTKFKALCDTFFKNKNDFYQARKKDNAANIQLKTELCIAAEGLKESTEWKATSQELIRLQEEWKKIGHVFDKQNQKLWDRFKAACDDFFNHKNSHFSTIDKEQDENYTKKIALIEAIEKFEMSDDNQSNLDHMRDYQRQWTEIGLVPMKKKDEVHQRYKAAIDSLYNNLKMDEREKSKMRFSHTMDDMRSNAGGNRRDGNRDGGRGNTGAGKPRGETGVISNKIAELTSEVTVWQNNIGFFGKSKNAEVIRKEFEDKINKAKDEIGMLKQKLKELKESE